MKISERGQITIPKHLRERFGMNHNVEVEISPTEQGLLIRKRTVAEHPVDRVYGILGRDALGEGVSVDDYIEEIRGR
ncbi:MAG: AbrB/MazE/SpoVT family DNA-binding domain-containing protein [Chloroflexi bacterium]|nr:AbrB/MazE/SpoVT family DNA-binding domain-containing protein [Chloroflexota bacterium]